VKAEPRFVLDASALLIYLQQQPGYEKVQRALAQGAVMSSVNLAEVFAKLIARDLPLSEIAANLTALGLGIASFTEGDAQQSAFALSKNPLAGAFARRPGVPCLGRASGAAGPQFGSSLEASAWCPCRVSSLT